MKLLKLCCNKYFLFCFLLWSVVLLIYYTTNESLIVTLGHRFSILGESSYRNVNDDLNISMATRARQECIHPQLTVNDTDMLKQLKIYPPVKCIAEQDWVYVDNGTVRFSPEAMKKYKPISCDYYPLVREGDHNIMWGPSIEDIPEGFAMTTDVFRVNCTGKNDNKYEGVHMGVAFTKERAERPAVPMPASMDSVSIVVLGFDSMSRMSWLRRLTKTREYFHNTLGAIELEAHNIVGDGTTAVMFPMLTGKFEWELPECRRNFKGATTLDKFPFLWHEMKKLGYLTSWCNGAPKSAPFNWRMLGFAEQPTDFYSRPFYMANPKINRAPTTCVGSRTQSKIWLNYFRDIFLMYKNKRKFLFHFITEFSHDNNNYITLIDEDLRDLVRFLYENDYLNNTIIILMGDHGARYSNLRSTWNGKLEERLPYFSVLFPDWFKKKYSQAVRNFEINSKRLTTPFDLYETFKDIIHFDGKTSLGNVSQRGISLFKEIPLARSCEHAHIAAHWCACLAWKNVSVNNWDTKKALQFALDTINNYTAEYREDCALLEIANVTMATKLETRSEVLKFKSTDSVGGIYKIDLTAKSKNEMVLYQLTFYTNPGGGHFEVTVTHHLVQKKFSLSDKEISRINKYGNDPQCILEKNRQIRPYCYCNKKYAILKSHVTSWLY